MKKTFLKAALENLAEGGLATPTPNEEEIKNNTGEDTPVEPALSEEDLAVVETEAHAEAEAVEEAQELETAVEELDGEIDEAVKDTETVSEVAETLEQSAENGGVPPEAMRAVEVATESLLQKYDLSLKHSIPALESFSDMKTRSAQTKYAAESFAEKAKEIGGKVMDGIRAMIKWLQDMFAKYLTAAGRLEARAKTVKDAATKAKDAKQQEVQFGGFLSKAKALAIDGALPADVPGAVNGVVTMAFKSAGAAAEVDRLLSKITAINQVKGPQDTAFGKIVEELEAQATDFFGKSAAAADADESKARNARQKGFDIPESTSVRATEILPGNKVIWGLRDKSTGGAARFGISTKPQEFKAQKVKTLSIDQIQKLAESAIGAASLKKKINEVSLAVGKAAAVLNKDAIGSKWSGEGKEDGAMAKFKEVISAVRDTISLAGAFHRPAVQVAMATASAGLDLAEASLKVYGAAPAATGGEKKEEKKD